MAPMTRFLRLGINVVITIGLVVATYSLVTYRQHIIDWWALRSYSPPAAITHLAERTSMQGYGRDVFYVSQPQVLGRDLFNQHCANIHEKSAVLGCYSAQRIYIFDVEDTRLNGVKEVTAGHEMLHAAYERLLSSERTALDALLRTQLDSMQQDARLQEAAALYDAQHLLNEMHSILGTEYRNLNPELELYYGRYFSDRTKVVAFAETYQGSFRESQARMEHLTKQLGQLKVQIDANTTQLEQRQAALGQRSAQLDTLRQFDPQAYNAAVPQYNNQVRAYNTLAVQTRELVVRYNDFVAQHNNEAAAQRELYQSLDSKHQPVPAD